MFKFLSISYLNMGISVVKYRFGDKQHMKNKERTEQI